MIYSLMMNGFMHITKKYHFKGNNIDVELK